MARNKIRRYYILVLIVFFVGSAVLSLLSTKSRRTVKLLLKDRETESLVIERALIPKTSSANEKIGWILKELISGPIKNEHERVFDPNIEVKNIIIKSTTAYISFDWSFIESLYENPSLAVRSIVNSILMNLKELKEVKILIEGIEPISTFCDVSLQIAFKKSC
jgi:hypothetical protein